MEPPLSTRGGQRPPVEAARPIRYEDDLHDWSLQQVEYWRRNQLDRLDVDHLAEEIGDVGRDRSTTSSPVRSQIVLLHPVKWDVQPERRSRSWVNSIAEHRERIRFLLLDIPSLKPKLADALDRAWRTGRLACCR